MSPTIDDLVGVALAAVPPAEEGDGRLWTAAVLRRLAASWRTPLDAPRRADIETLCRKIGIAGRVWDRYEPGWRRAADAAPLSGHLVLLLIAVLVAYATSQADGEPERELGLGLKMLNAAFVAMELLPASEISSLRDDLAAIAERALHQLAAPWPQ